MRSKSVVGDYVILTVSDDGVETIPEASYRIALTVCICMRVTELVVSPAA